MIKICWFFLFIAPVFYPAIVLGNAPQQPDTNRWIDHFREFRTAVYQQDKNKVKSFIDFPIMNDNNEIWDMVYQGKGGPLLSDKIKPFTEKDFDLHYNKLFTKRFIAALLKIKTDELYTKGETETVTLHDGAATTYKIIASFDKQAHLLQLNLASDTIIKNASGEVEDGGEYNEIYYFIITAAGKIKFKQIRLAG